jgi:hypothetical protein
VLELLGQIGLGACSCFLAYAAILMRAGSPASQFLGDVILAEVNLIRRLRPAMTVATKEYIDDLPGAKGLMTTFPRPFAEWHN